MSFLNNLNETCELLNKLDDVMMKNVDNNLIKQQLLSLTEDLARYKDIDVPTRKTGCAALDMAYVAAGRFDGYFQENLNLWDIAAGIVLVREAGGVLNSIELSKKENLDIRASSSSINEKILKKLNKF